MKSKGMALVLTASQIRTTCEGLCLVYYKSEISALIHNVVGYMIPVTKVEIPGKVWDYFL